MGCEEECVEGLMERWVDGLIEGLVKVWMEG